jgi:hypothetical protein
VSNREEGLVTEEDAKEKWCPFARVIERDCDGSTRARNRVVHLDAAGNVLKEITDTLAGTRCIGSACMAWRWEKSEAKAVEGYQTPDGQSITTRWARIDPVDGAGFCGLAGKP